MGPTLREQFLSYADCCLELALWADTPARRWRLMKMAHEYRLATAIVTSIAPRPIGANYDQPPG